MIDKVGVLVFTSQEILEHKKRDGKVSEDAWCYWRTTLPRKCSLNPSAEWRIYFAVKGQVQGYFIIDEYGDDGLIFDSESWTPIENGETLKPSQGWRYYVHD